MKYAIDETELARLEQLKEDSDNNRTVYGGDTIATVWYQSEAANAVPALVAEVRRLRAENVSLREDVYALNEAWDCEHEALMRHEHMVADLMEKVEAWEWYNECRIYDPWREHPYWTACGRSSHLRKDQNSIGTRRARALENAIAEWHAIVESAREVVHADRE